MVVGIYIRVSTREQAEEGYSIGAQKDRLISYCHAQGWTDYRIYVDEGVSAKDMKRPQLIQLMEDIKAGRINLILVYRLDRFTRRVRDLHEMLEFLEKYQCKFRSATEMYDTTTAMGRMFIGLVALMAQWEVENMSERISFALEKKVTDGEHVGAPPFGYDSIDEKLVKNEREGALLMQMIMKFEVGWSASKVAEYMTKKEGRPWYHNSIINILKNPALYGAKRWNGKIIESPHEPYISKERFDKLQAILDDRSKNRRVNTENTYLFQGVLQCPSCDKSLNVNRYFYLNKTTEREEQRAVYRCNECRKKGIDIPVLNEEKYVESLFNYMNQLSLDDVAVKPKTKPDDKERNRLTKDLQRITNQREKYQRAWSMDLITDEEFNARMQETKEHLDTIQSQINLLSPTDRPEQVDTEFLRQLVITFKECFKVLSSEEQREFVQKFIRKIEIEYIHHAPSSHSRNPKKGRSSVNIKNIQFY